MIYRLTVLLLAACMAVLNTWGTGGKTKCLLIGCDRFVSMPSTEPASANNTSAMASLLLDFLPGKVTVSRKVNNPGTVDSLADMIRETFRDTTEQDTALIYFSTHGVLWQEDGRRRMALLLSDGEREERLTPEKLRELLDTIPGKIVLILDACHSGAMIGRGADDFPNLFDNPRYRVLVSSGADEDSLFWNAETSAYIGTGYFTAALENALRASDPEQIDPNGNRRINLEELTKRLREIHGASTVYCQPERSREVLFRMPADRMAGSRLRGLSFGEPEQDGDAVLLPVHFRAEEEVRVMYQLVPALDGQWDFDNAVRLPDRERTSLIRGLVSPGEKDRKIRLTRQSLGGEGTALMQIITLQGEGLVPVTEAGKVVRISRSP